MRRDPTRRVSRATLPTASRRRRESCSEELPMTQKQWTAVDHYLTESLVQPDAHLDAALADGEAAGLPPLSVAPNQGKLLHLLARAIGARNILEIGTLAGYSTIWLARALPKGGRLVTLEA